MKPKCDMEGRGQNAPGLITPQQRTYCRNLGERPAKHILGEEREVLVGHLKERALTNPRGLFVERMSLFGVSFVTRLVVDLVCACGGVCDGL